MRSAAGVSSVSRVIAPLPHQNFVKHALVAFQCAGREDALIDFELLFKQVANGYILAPRLQAELLQLRRFGKILGIAEIAQSNRVQDLAAQALGVFDVCLAVCELQRFPAFSSPVHKFYADRFALDARPEFDAWRTGLACSHFATHSSTAGKLIHSRPSTILH